MKKALCLFALFTASNAACMNLKTITKNVLALKHYNTFIVKSNTGRFVAHLFEKDLRVPIVAITPVKPLSQSPEWTLECDHSFIAFGAALESALKKMCNTSAVDLAYNKELFLLIPRFKNSLFFIIKKDEKFIEHECKDPGSEKIYDFDPKRYVKASPEIMHIIAKEIRSNLSSADVILNK